MAPRWRSLIRSTTARLVVLAFLFQMLVTAGVLLFVQQASQHALIEEQQALVGELRDELRGAYAGGGQTEVKRLILTRLRSVRSDAVVILLADRAGMPVAGNIAAWPTVIPSDTDWRTIDLYRMGADQPEHMGVATTRLPDGSRLLTGHVIDANLRLTRVNAEAMLAALLIGLSLTLVGTLAFGRLLSRKIQGVVATAAAVGDGALARRVPVDGSGDAFDALGESINVMLQRIEALVSQLRMMTDGLAHDLRSPVTRLKSVLERAIVETRDTEALTALEKASAEADTLLSMLSTALLISRAEAGIGRESLVESDLATLLSDLVEVYGPLVEDRGFTIAADAQTGLTGRLHRELVSQAIGNLIENALNHGEGGSAIMLVARDHDGILAVEVADNGPGIPSERRSDALRRFGRLDPSRHRPGSGLGLSLVEAVAGLHHGAISLEDNQPGLRVVMTLGPAIVRQQ